MATEENLPIRVLLIHDRPSEREILKNLLGNGSMIKVVGEVENIDQALRLIAKTKPDMIVLGVDRIKISVLGRLSEIKATIPLSRILLITEQKDEKIDEQALRGGAHGLIARNGTPTTLLRAVHKVHEGEIWFSRKLTSRIVIRSFRFEHLAQQEPAKIKSLTKRELEISRLIGAGMVNKSIAEDLSISEKTVRNHLSTIYCKIGVSNRLELAIFASKNGLIG